nr:S-layer homology domain-containing protein [uncultured Aminipila sp.]
MKKVLSFVLILALVLSSFSMAFAGSTTELKNLSDVAGNKNAEAIEVAYDLGVVTGNPDGTFQPAKAVTRAEFAAMITRALAIPQSALAGYANTSFKDTNGYSWAVPYLAFCNSKGIMLGDGAGNAMPGKTITVNESVTMALRAIGYTANSSELVGVWPSNYVTKAQELELYDDVAKDATGVDKANAAQVIYNLLGVQKVAVNSDGETKKLWDKEPKTNGTDGVATTLLSSGLNCKTDGFEVVTSSDLEDSLINMAKHVGEYGSIYRNSDDEVVAFIKESDDTLTGRFKIKDGNLKFVTTADESEYSVNATTATAFLINGEGSNTDINIRTDARVSNSAIDSVKTTEFAISVDLTGKTIKEVYGVNTWIANQAEQVEKSDLDEITNDKSLLNEDFALDNDNTNIDYTKFNLVGVNSVKDIKEDNIVYVYTAGSDDEIIKIEVGTQVAEGVVKSFKDAKEDVATKFAIGANTYKNAAEVLNGNAVEGGDIIEDGNVSDEVKAFIDARGFVYDFENSSKADNFAVIKKAGGIDQVQMMTADGTTKTYSYDDDKDKAGKLTGSALIGYGLNNAGTITDANKNFVSVGALTLSSVNVISAISGVDTNPAALGSGVDPADATALNNTKGLKIDSKCAVFTYKAGSSLITDLDVTTIDKVEVDKTIAGALLLFDEDNDGKAKMDKVVAMLVPDTMAKGGDKSYAVLNDRDSDSNADGDKVWAVSGYKDGVDIKNVATDDQTSFDGWKAPQYKDNLFKYVAVYEVKVDAAGLITKGDAVKLSSDVYRTEAFEVATADKRKSVVASTNIEQDTATEKTHKDIDAGKMYALSTKVVIYQVTDDNKYKTYGGSINDGDYVQLFETDDDEDGFDIVILHKK